jgi:DNA invertase Pin-like site-specific DNA recombinase
MLAKAASMEFAEAKFLKPIVAIFFLNVGEVFGESIGVNDIGGLSASPPRALVGEFTEVESGKRNDRPELVKALAACKKQKAKLVIAKLDRLSRNLAFIATLMDSGVEFVAVDNPHANKLTIHILAAVAQHERKIISARTSAALKAAKARGKRLGNPKLSEARRHATAARKESADRFCTNILPVIREIQRSGIKSLRGIARALAARGIPTARGGAWTPVQVSAILQRAS